MSPLKLLSHVLPEPVTHFFLRLMSRKLKRQLAGEVTDDFLELLLAGMSLAFLLSKPYRRNIEGFTGRYAFGTADGRVMASAVFSGGHMAVGGQALPGSDISVTLASVPAFWRFAFSENQDILNSILANEVEVVGNFNYLYKFGFMARDLARRLGAL